MTTPSLTSILPNAAIPKGQSPEVPPVAVTLPLLMIMSPLRLRIAVEDVVVAVTSALMVSVPS